MSPSSERRRYSQPRSQPARFVSFGSCGVTGCGPIGGELPLNVGSVAGSIGGARMPSGRGASLAAGLSAKPSM
jgi:hypothetical protein